MIDREALLKQFKKDILNIKDNDSKKLFYIIIYNILKRKTEDDFTIYNSDFAL